MTIKASPSPAKKAKTRPALMAAGLKLLAERPIDSLAIDEIVEAAGVAKGSFFNHFHDKQSFAREIAAEIRLEVEREVSAANLGVDDPLRRLVRGVARFVRFAQDDPEKARVFIRTAGLALSPDHPLNAGVRRDVAEGLEQGRLDAPGPDAVLLHVGAITSVMMSRAARGEPTTGGVRRLFVEVFGVTLRGLGVSPTQALPMLEAAAAEMLAP